MTAAVAGRAGACDLVWVEGPDADGFLQGLLTNDVSGLEVGGSCRALFLDNTGHIRADMRVMRTAAQDFTLVTGSGDGVQLVALLDEFHFSEDVDILGPEAFSCVTLAGREIGPIEGADVVLPGPVPGTVDAIGVDADVIMTATGAAALDDGLLEAWRITAGVPVFGVDFTSVNLVQEAGLVPTTVSFDKGCYLGQETVARVHYRGQVNRRLCGLLLVAPAKPGAALQLGDRHVGVLSSVAASPDFGSIGLAMLRREVVAGDQILVEGLDHPATAVDLPLQNAHKTA